MAGPTPNPGLTLLEQYPAARKIAYTIQWTVNLVLAIMAFVLASLGDSPLWFIIVGGAFNILWSYTGLTASSNVGVKIVAARKKRV